MLDAILGIASSSGLGAIVGLVGSYMAKKEQRLLDQMNNEHELSMANVDMQRDAAESAQALEMADNQIEQVIAEGAIQSDIVAGEAFTASQRQAAKSSGVTWIDGLRSSMRPLITIYLLIIVTVITYHLNRIIGGLEVIPAADLYQLYSHIIDQAVFLTVTAVLWWFGSRGGNHAKR